MEIVKSETIRKSENLFAKQWHITLKLTEQELALPRKTQKQVVSAYCKQSNNELSDIFWFPKFMKRKDGFKVVWTHYQQEALVLNEALYKVVEKTSLRGLPL